MSNQAREVLRGALLGLLRPSVRFALKYGFRVQDFLEAGKVAFLDVAEDEIKRGGHEVSISKLSVITGIHRRDVMRLWRDEEEPKADTDVVMRIIGQWQADRRFSVKGKPKVLQLSGVTGDFRELVHSVSQDLNPYTVLYELERASAVKVDDDGIHLVAHSLQISGDAKRGLSVLSKDSDDLSSAVTENLLQEPEQLNLHIRTEFDNIPPEYEAEIRLWLIEEGAKFHKRAHEFLAKHDRDTSQKLSSEKKSADKKNADKKIKKDGSGVLRAVLGSFSFTEKR